MKLSNKILALFMAVIVSLTLSVPAFAAPKSGETTETAETTKAAMTEEEAEAAAETAAEVSEAAEEAETKDRTVDAKISSFNNPNGRILSMSRGGIPRIHPEDSEAGIKQCVEIGVDIISVHVRKTKDGQLVLLEDDTIDRMLVDPETKKAGSGKVSSYTLKQLQNNYVLRERSGGAHNKASESKILSLAEALAVCNDSMMLYIVNGFEYPGTINTLARETKTTDIVILGGAEDPDTVKSFVGKVGTPLCLLSTRYVDGETKGSAKDFLTNSLSSGASSVLLEAGKEYSPVFKEATIRKAKGEGRAIASFTDYDRSGERKDNITGWEELIKAGYSIIETDYPEELCLHIREIEAYRANLTALITTAQTLSEDNYEKSTFNAMQHTLKQAEEITATGCISLADLDDARYDLQETMDALEYGTAVPKKHTPAWLVIAILLGIVLAVALLTILGLRFFNRRKKYHQTHDKVLEEFKQQSESNLATAKTKVDIFDSPISTDGTGDNILDNLGGDKAAAAVAAEEAEAAAAQAQVEIKLEEEARKEARKEAKKQKTAALFKRNRKAKDEAPAADKAGAAADKATAAAKAAGATAAAAAADVKTSGEVPFVEIGGNVDSGLDERPDDDIFADLPRRSAAEFADAEDRLTASASERREARRMAAEAEKAAAEAEAALKAAEEAEAAAKAAEEAEAAAKAAEEALREAEAAAEAADKAGK